MNYRMDISYDGSKYRGWQRQKTTSNTIQGKIEETLSKYLDSNILITGASRTDAGVHANMQVVNFKTNKFIDTEQFLIDINHYLPRDIIVMDIYLQEERFHSRHSAIKKTYTYKIWKFDAKYPPLFNRKYVYVYDKVLDVNMMTICSKKFLGSHDFKGFSSDKTKKGTVRNIENISIVEDEFSISISITGDGFLYNMVRIIIGTMLEISTKDKNISIIDQAFKSGNRELVGFTCPGNALFLENIVY